MCKNVVFLLFFIQYGSFLFSQVEGLVIDKEGSPVNKVNVFLVDQNLLLYTNNEGVFSVDKSIPNNTYIEFYKFGYSSKLIKYQSGKKIQIILEKLHVELDDIGVSESFSHLGDNKTVNIEKKSLDNVFLSNSIVNKITEISGLHSSGSGLAIQKIVIRGLSGMRVVSLVNGMRVENQQWAGDHGIGFTDLGFTNVELIKGSSALKYGAEAVGGLLYFNDEPFIESVSPSGFIAAKFDDSHFLFGNQFGLKWSKNNFFINFYGENTLASDYRLPNKTFLYNSRFRNQAIKLSIANIGSKIQSVLRYQYNTEKLGIPAHFHGDSENVVIDDLTFSNIDLTNDYDLRRPLQIVNNHLFIFENNYFNNNNRYSLYLGHFINNLIEYEKWTYPGFDMTLSTTLLRADLRRIVSDITFNTGFSIGLLKNQNNILEYLIPNANSNDLGFYTSLDYDKVNKGANLGFRFDFKNISSYDENYDKSFSSLSSSSGLYLKNNNHTFRITYSSSFRSPHFSELFSDGVHHGTTRYEVGNRNLKLEKAHQFDFKYQWSNDHIGLVLNPFSQYIYDFISINPTSDFIQNYRLYNYEQFSKVTISGFEMNLHYHPHFMHDLHFEQNYSFLNTKNHDNDNYLALTPANNIKTRISLNLENKNLFFGIKSFGLYNIYSFKQDKVAEDETTTKSYSLFNLDLSLKPLRNLNISFNVMNLCNIEYVPHLSRLKDIGLTGVPNPGRSFNLSCKYDF